MANGFVNLQTELAAAKNQRSGLLRTLRGGMQRGSFFSHARCVLQKLERLDEFVAFQSMLAAKTIRIRALLNFVALKRSGGDTTASDQFALMNARADTRRKPGIDFAKLHSGFRQGDAFDAAHFAISGEEKSELVLQRKFERILAKRALPTVDVGVFGDHDHVAALRERRSFGNRDGLRRAGRDALAGEVIGGCEAPCAIRQS